MADEHSGRGRSKRSAEVHGGVHPRRRPGPTSLGYHGSADEAAGDERRREEETEHHESDREPTKLAEA